MNFLRITILIAVLLAGLLSASAQGFINRGFESTTISIVHYPGGDRYFATLPRWSYSGVSSEGGPGTVNYNTVALDAPAVTLQGTDSLFAPAIQGSYSVLLQGGTTAGGMVYGTNGASVFQTGQIPASSLSLIYLGGGAVQVSFNGQALPHVALSSTANYTMWGADVSAYAGQSGELRFTAPWLTTGILDGIQFSSTAIPEPSAFALLTLGLLCLFVRASQFALRL
jgi:hypothetical protein